MFVFVARPTNPYANNCVVAGATDTLRRTKADVRRLFNQKSV